MRGVDLRRDGSINIVVHNADPIATHYALPSSGNWGTEGTAHRLAKTVSGCLHSAI